MICDVDNPAWDEQCGKMLVAILHLLLVRSSDVLFNRYIIDFCFSKPLTSDDAWDELMYAKWR